jgi:membrane protein DedA with SNARE-associated domain
MVETWLEHYGYIAVLLGTFFEGESVLLLAGALAHRGFLSAPLVGLAAFVGAVIGDQTWFRVGRHYGPAFLARHPRLQKHHARADALLARFGNWFVIGFRFIVGIRSVTPLFLGTTTYRASRFLVLNVIGCAVWSAAITAAGYFLGAGIKELFDRAGHIEELVLAALAVLAVLFVLTRSFWMRAKPPTDPLTKDPKSPA